MMNNDIKLMNELINSTKIGEIPDGRRDCSRGNRECFGDVRRAPAPIERHDLARDPFARPGDDASARVRFRQPLGTGAGGHTSHHRDSMPGLPRARSLTFPHTFSS